jgi:hypothetical protein
VILSADSINVPFGGSQFNVGLTQESWRALFAAMALQGMLANNMRADAALYEEAIAHAECLIAALAATDPGAA